MSPGSVAAEARVRNDELSDAEVQAFEDAAVRINFWPIGSLPSHPEWVDTYCAESRSTFEFIGFVGRIGLSQSYGFDDGLPGDRGKGRKKSLPEAILALVQLAEVES